MINRIHNWLYLKFVNFNPAKENGNIFCDFS